MTSSNHPNRGHSRRTAGWLAAALLLALPGTALADDIQAVDGPCRIRLRSGRIMDAAGLQAASDAGGFWRIVLEGGSSLVVPVRELKRVEGLPRTGATPIAALTPASSDDEVFADPLAAIDTRCDPGTDPRITRWDSLLHDAATRNGVDVDLVRAIVSVESCGNPDAVSRKGAIGLMQLLPRTAADYGCKDPREPGSNVDAGCRHLARLVTKPGGKLPLVLAAYNAGEKAVERSGGIPKFRETEDYVKNVLARHAKLVAAAPGM